ncbi:MAG: hypothetical protein ACE148_13200 [Vicinamibacterales bacterium]
MPDIPAREGGYVALQASSPPVRTQVGCMTALGAPLLLVGGGLIAVFFINPAGTGEPLVMPVVGGPSPSWGWCSSGARRVGRAEPESRLPRWRSPTACWRLVPP